MIKLEVFDQERETVEIPTVRLELVLVEDGGVVVRVVNRYGEKVSQGDLLEFCSDGTVEMYSNINTSLGFLLDAAGVLQWRRGL